MLRVFAAWLTILALGAQAAAAEPVDDRFPLFSYLSGEATPRMICYTPSQLDPRNAANQRALLTSSLRADLEALRPAFDGLVLYGYHEANTPRLVAVAKQLKYRAVLLAIWDPKSSDELDGVAELAQLHHKDMAIGVIVGNEGITFKRYELEDLAIAALRVRAKLPKTVPITTSEPMVGYKHDEVRAFGDFLAPNIHPVFDRESLAAGDAAAWAREQALALAKTEKKPVLLKETGFPHAGKPAYTPESQAAFWKAYVKPGLVARVRRCEGVGLSWRGLRSL
jgi:exo-beta-1,3-glucanase (GH17 family)